MNKYSLKLRKEISDHSCLPNVRQAPNPPRMKQYNKKFNEVVEELELNCSIGNSYKIIKEET